MADWALLLGGDAKPQFREAETQYVELATSENHGGDGKAQETRTDDREKRCNEPVGDSNTETDQNDEADGVGDAPAKH
jgi:hypothetical protein